MIREDRDEIHRHHTKAGDMSLGEAWSAAYTEDDLRMRPIMQTGAPLSVLTSIINVTELGVQ